MKLRQTLRRSELLRRLWVAPCVLGCWVVFLTACGASIGTVTPTVEPKEAITDIHAELATKTLAFEPTATPPIAATAMPSPTAESTTHIIKKPSRVSLTSITPSAPSYVKRQIALPIGGGGDPFSFWIDPANIPDEPMLMNQDDLDRRRSFGAWAMGLSNGFICGYSQNETLSIRLFDPANLVVFEDTAQTVNVPVRSGSNINTNCFRIKDVDVHESEELLPGAPLGEYAIEITGSSSRITIPFELVLPYAPTIFWSISSSSFVLAGFDAGEEVIVLFFREDAQQPTPKPDEWPERRGSLMGSFRLTANLDGTLIIDASELSQAVEANEIAVFALGKKGHYASFEKETPPVDFSAMIASEPENAVAWYLNGMYGHGEDRQGAFNDLSKAIELAPLNAELYLARAAKASSRGDVLADLTRAIELKPDHADAYLQRAELWETGIDPDDQQRAISDYERFLEFAYNVANRFDVQQHLRKLAP